MRHMRGVFPL
ncbi:UNVERIFIED_CONTAM: hypothetical protein GTU68_026421 [Idotea baltica]|nr:hypothetical protein [Idotea baltica]